MITKGRRCEISLVCSKKRLTLEEVSKIISMKESWDIDMKAKEIKPAKLSRTLSALVVSEFLRTFVSDGLLFLR